MNTSNVKEASVWLATIAKLRQIDGSIIQVCMACMLLAMLCNGCISGRNLTKPNTSSDVKSSQNFAEPVAENVNAPGDRAVVLASYQVDDAVHSPNSVTTAAPPGSIEVPVTTEAVPFQTNIASMSVSDFEALAFANNPSIQELAASTRKAAGFRTQVGLRANPTIGYQGMQIADKGTDQHAAFIEQQIITGGKLGLNQRVLNETLRAQLWELEAQKYRIQTDIRVKFYEALAAQDRIKLVTEFQELATKSLNIAELRKKAMEGSQVEVLQAKVQLNGVELVSQQAEIQFRSVWGELVAMAGSPQLAPTNLQGSFEGLDQAMDWDSTWTNVLNGSPEYKAAATRIQRARANIDRQKVQSIPNLTSQLAAGVDNGTNSGMINYQIGAPIPVFNMNQGNIAAAQAEYCRAIAEAKRIENSMQSRLASVSRDFESSLAAVNKYSNDILPSVKQTLDMAETAYKAGEFSFLEVFTVRRTYFESNLQFLLAKTQLAQADAKVKGFVLTGGLDATLDLSGDDSLRGLTMSQQ